MRFCSVLEELEYELNLSVPVWSDSNRCFKEMKPKQKEEAPLPEHCYDGNFSTSLLSSWSQ